MWKRAFRPFHLRPILGVFNATILLAWLMAIQLRQGPIKIACILIAIFLQLWVFYIGPVLLLYKGSKTQIKDDMPEGEVYDKNDPASPRW